MLVGGAAQLYQIKRTSDVDLSCPLLLSNWESMKSGEIQWLLAHYSSSKEVVFFQSGNLVVDMIQYLNPDSVYYGAFVVYHDSIRRHVFFSYVGDDVAGMKRARVSMHKSALSNYFQGSIYTMSLSQPEELNVQYVLSCLSSVGIEPSSVSIDFTCREDIHSLVETTDVKTSETELMLLSRSTIGGQPHPPSEWLGDSSEFDFDGKSIWYELASFIHSLSPQDSSMPLSVPSCSGSIDCSLPSWVTEVLNCHLCPPLEDLIKLRTVLSKSMHAPLVIQVGGMESLPIIWNNISLDTIDKPGTKTLSKLLLVACMCELASHLLKNVCTTSNFSSDNDQSQKKISSSPSSPAATTTETRHAMTKPKETKEISISSSQVCDNNKTVNPEASLIQSRAQKTESSGEDSGKKVNPVASLIQSRAQKTAASGEDSGKKVNPEASLIQSRAQKTENSGEDSGKKVNPVASLIQSRAQQQEGSDASDKKVNPVASLIQSRAQQQEGSDTSDKKVNPVASLIQSRAQTTAASGEDSGKKVNPVASLIQSRAQQQEGSDASDKKVNPVASLIQSRAQTTAASGEDSGKKVNPVARLIQSRAQQQEGSDASDKKVNPVASLIQSRAQQQEGSDASDKKVNPVASLIQSRAQTTAASGEDSGKKVNPVASLIQSRAQQQEGSDASDKKVNPVASLIQSRAQKTAASGEDSDASDKKVNPVASLIQSRAQQQEGSDASDKKVNPVASLIQSRAQKTAASGEDSDASDKKVNPVASLIQSKAQKTESSSEDSGKKVNPVASLIQSRAQKTESSNENCGDESCTDVTSDRGVTDMTVSSNSSVKVVYQMRQCYWEPVADCEGTIFDPAVPAAGDIDKMGSNYLSEGVLDSLREVFTKTITIRELTEEERIGQAVGAIGGKLKKGSLTFMDQRRFNNVAIKLRQMNKSNEFIKTAVLRLDEEFLTPERVQSLLECAPTGDDMESIAPYDGDPDLLAVCERFFYDIQSVPLFTKRIEAMKARLEFEAGVEDVLSQLGDLTHAILSVANSSALAVFIRVVLKFGNVMNCGSSRGSAIGFDISFLPKLSYIKSGDLKTNLMRFVVNHLDSEDTSVIDSLLRSLAPCAKAAKVNFHRVDGAITLLKKRLNSIKMTRTSLLNINKRRKDGKLPDDFFEEKMGSFMTSAEALLEQMLSGEVTRVRHVYNLLNRFLGMVSSDSNETSASASLFSVLLDLCRNVEEARRTTAALLAREREIALKHDALVRAAESRTVIKASRLRQETSVGTNSPKTSVQSSLRKSTGYGHGNNSREESATEVLESEIARVRARMRASGTSQSRSLLNISSEQALKNTIHINGEQNVAHASLNGVKRPLNHSKINSNSRPCEDMTIGTLTVSRSCVQASMDMQNPESDTNWVGMRLDCTSNRLELVGKGGHGLSEMTEWVGQIGSACAATSTALDQSYHSRQCTSTDLPSVVYFRVIGVDEAFRRSKFVAVYFINPNLPMKLRAHMSHMKRHIQSFLSGVHVEFSVEDSLAELTEESVTRKLLAAGGAHAPKSFVF